MGARMTKLPEGYFRCVWCKAGVRFIKDGNGKPTVVPDKCPHCDMHPNPSGVDRTVGGKVDPETAKSSARNKRAHARTTPLGTEKVGEPVLGLDPGARYTGIVVRDGDVVLYSATLVRDDGMGPFEWADYVADECQVILFEKCPEGTKVGIEGVTVPKGFKNGKKQPVNPGPILFTGVVAGALKREFKEAVIVPPGGNGSQHITNYPPELVGKRPKDLPGSSNGAGTRAHEQSAYDVAGKAAKEHYPKVKKSIFD